MKVLTAPDLQTLHRKIYTAQGFARTSMTLEQKHEAQRRYEIVMRGNKFVALPKKPKPTHGDKDT
jgi:hypothetical protein